jgi:hypothetical protein
MFEYAKTINVCCSVGNSGLGIFSVTCSDLDQLQLVPSGGDSGPCRTSTELKFSVIYIRVQLPEIKCMELVS